MNLEYLFRRLRDQLMSREALAAKSNRSFSTISNMLAGKRVSLDVAQDVADALNCKVEDFAPELVEPESLPAVASQRK